MGTLASTREFFRVLREFFQVLPAVGYKMPELSPYAQPVFVRILGAAETRVAFKLLKGALREQAFHLDKVNADRVYVRKPRSKTYEILDDDFCQ